MRKISILLLLLLLLSVRTADAECFLDCLFQPGTECVNGVCVPKVAPTPTPTPTPTPVPTPSISEIRLEMALLPNIVVKEVDCSGMDVKNIKVFLKRKFPPAIGYFYSAIYHSQNQLTRYYVARKDIRNEYVFLPVATIAEFLPQVHGQDFAFNQWENVAFKEIFANMTCEELKKSGWFFTSGISTKADRTDFEGGTFTFK